MGEKLKQRMFSMAWFLWMSAHVHAYTCVYMCVHVETRDQGHECFLQSLSTLFFESLSLTDPEAHIFGQSWWQQASNPPAPVSGVQGLQVCTTAPSFYMVLRIKLSSSCFRSRYFLIKPPLPLHGPSFKKLYRLSVSVVPDPPGALSSDFRIKPWLDVFCFVPVLRCPLCTYLCVCVCTCVVFFSLCVFCLFILFCFVSTLGL